MSWTGKISVLLLIFASFVMETVTVNVTKWYASVSLHALRPPVSDRMPIHLIDSVNLLQELQVSSNMQEEYEDVPGR